MKIDRYQAEIDRLLKKTTSPALRKMLREMAATVSKNIAAGVPASEAIRNVTKGIAPALFSVLSPALFQAACAGYGILPSIVINPAAVSRALDRAWTSDRMKLSERLHGTSIDMRNAIIKEISTALKENAEWRATSRKLYDGYGFKTTINPAELPKYLQKLADSAKRAMMTGHIDPEALADYQKQLRKAAKLIGPGGSPGSTTAPLKAGYRKLMISTDKLTEKRLQNAIMVATEERARYYADRIARTEMARAWFDGFVAKHMDDDSVTGFKWRLNSGHPKSDICDLHSSVDFYGMGKGVYPKNKIPAYPAHPHCRCYLSVIYFDEAPEPGPFNPKAGDDWLQNADPHVRKAILGVRGEQAWRDGRIGWMTAAKKRGWEGHLDIPSRIKPADIAPPAVPVKPAPPKTPAQQVKTQPQNQPMTTTTSPPPTAYKKDVQDWIKAGSPKIPAIIASGTPKIPAAFAFMTWVRSGSPAQPSPEHTWVRTPNKGGAWVLPGQKVKAAAAPAKTRSEMLAEIKQQDWQKSFQSDTHKQEVMKYIEDLTDAELQVFVKRGKYIGFDAMYDRAQTPFYSNRTQKITMDITDVDGIDIALKHKTAVSTFFHEVGHLMDLKPIVGEKTWGKILNKLPSMLEEEFLEFARQVSGKTWLSKIEDTYDPKVKGWITVKISGAMRSGVSDIISGLTKDRVRGTWGHKSEYWNAQTDGLLKEAIANMFEAAMIKGQRESEMRRIFPRSFEYFMGKIFGEE